MLQSNLPFSGVKGQARLLPLLSCLYGSPREHALPLFHGQSSHQSPGRARQWNACTEDSTLQIRKENSDQAQLGIPGREKEISKHNINNRWECYKCKLRILESNRNCIKYSLMWRKQGKVATKGIGKLKKTKSRKSKRHLIQFQKATLVKLTGR